MRRQGSDLISENAVLEVIKIWLSDCKYAPVPKITARAYEVSARLAQACLTCALLLKSLEWTMDAQNICLLEGLLFGLIILCISDFEMLRLLVEGV